MREHWRSKQRLGCRQIDSPGEHAGCRPAHWVTTWQKLENYTDTSSRSLSARNKFRSGSSITPHRYPELRAPLAALAALLRQTSCATCGRPSTCSSCWRPLPPRCRACSRALSTAAALPLVGSNARLRVAADADPSPAACSSCWLPTGAPAPPPSPSARPTVTSSTQAAAGWSSRCNHQQLGGAHMCASGSAGTGEAQPGVQALPAACAVRARWEVKMLGAHLPAALMTLASRLLGSCASSSNASCCTWASLHAAEVASTEHLTAVLCGVVLCGVRSAKRARSRQGLHTLLGLTGPAACSSAPAASLQLPGRPPPLRPTPSAASPACAP